MALAKPTFLGSGPSCPSPSTQGLQSSSSAFPPQLAHPSTHRSGRTELAAGRDCGLCGRQAQQVPALPCSLKEFPTDMLSICSKDLDMVIAVPEGAASGP